MKVQVSTSLYERSNMGKGPKGNGMWMFADNSNYDFDGKTKILNAYCSYSEAKKQAIKWAKENGISTVYVLP